MTDTRDESASLLGDTSRDFIEPPSLPTRILYYPRTVRVLSRIVLVGPLVAIGVLTPAIVLLLLPFNKSFSAEWLLGELTIWTFALMLTSFVALLNRKSNFPLPMSLMADFFLIYVGLAVVGIVNSRSWPDNNWCGHWDYDEHLYIPGTPECNHRVLALRILLFTSAAVSLIVLISQLFLFITTVVSWLRRSLSVVRTPFGEFTISFSIKVKRQEEAHREHSALPATNDDAA